MRKAKKKKYLRSQPSILEQLEARRLLAVINVADFGARPNDGIDDTAAIQAAINASKPGDTINFGKGTLDAASIKILGNRTYTGEATIKRNRHDSWIFDASHGADGATIKGLTFDGGGIFIGVTARNVEITNTTIQNIGGGGYPYGNAIFIPAGAENSKFNHNTFVNINGENGIYGFNRFHNVEMNHNHFDSVFEGIHLSYNSGENLTVSNNTFIRTKRMAIELQGHNARGIYVENNVASEWRDRYHGSFFLSIVNQGYDVFIRNNHGASGKFGQIDPRANDAPVGIEVGGWGVSVENNVIEGFREGIHLASVRDTVVQNNKLYNQTWMAIWRTGKNAGGTNGINIRIEKNDIYNPRAAFYFAGSSTGVIQNNKITLFGDAREYDQYNDGAYNGISRPGNQVTRTNGSPQPYKGSSPANGGGGGGTTNPSPIVTAPSTPSNLQVSPASSTQIDLTWKNNSSNEDGYKIFRRDNSTTQWVLIATLDKNSNTYKDGDAKPGTHYSYKVQAFNARGHSAFSNEHDAWTSKPVTPPPPSNPAPVTTPSAPSGLKVSSRSATQLDVTWTNNANNQAAFKLFRREGDTGEWVLIATVDANATVYRDGSVQPDQTYTYRIQAYNAAGHSAFSNESQGRTPQSEPPPPVASRGLRGEYFNNMDLTNKKGERIDGVIDFNWGLGSPMDGISPDRFSVRWTGQIEPRYSEEYTFYAGSDDGVRLWIDGKLVIDSWHDQRNTEKVGKIRLEGGRKYDIRLEYYEHLVGASVHLAWSSASQAKEIVPQSRLSHTTSTNQPQPPVQGNLALGKKAVASSAQDGMWDWVDHLTNGDDTTRWASTMGRDGEWIYVDLGAVYEIERVRLNWETAFARSYLIQVSHDAKTWTTIHRTEKGDGGIDDLTGLSGSGRYVKMLGLERGYPAGYSLWSMEVYGAS